MKWSLSHRTRVRPLRALRSRMVRLRHIRGHGIHSPYVYRLVREVFMCRTVIAGADDRLLNEMSQWLMDRRMAIELHNLYLHCGYRSYLIDPAPEAMDGSKVDFVICTKSVSVNQIEQIYDRSLSSATTVVVELPPHDVEREELTAQIVASHRSTTIDKRRYIIIFNNHLPKQHFQL